MQLNPEAVSFVPSEQGARVDAGKEKLALDRITARARRSFLQNEVRMGRIHWDTSREMVLRQVLDNSTVLARNCLQGKDDSQLAEVQAALLLYLDDNP